MPAQRIDDGLREAMDWTVHDMASGTEDRPMFFQIMKKKPGSYRV